ncbi:leader peptidase (prepilin peptidase) / N-methyltransferase [Parasphingorhabdus marina DSM 22363]|uniref:Prepilin leader peptidase/N-methyltransferase n=1 Tax=Parasphingorhabdus marina DSM 22363 TaxID=1123272 RepID=A0A1N6F0T3_9SPHN|nr:A24 family peptidase [Parasphingorhabdus marina]SIN88880.1 leader peptidase (prepilin peptidase) / N-methyltransferase [Parasphingorhabdus marina DSM 22363]
MSLLFYPVAGAIFGLIIGSFLATVLVRWPAGESALGGRSRCDQCQSSLSARELIPVVSYILQSGKCRACRHKIAPEHPAMELTAAMIGALAFAQAPGVEGLLGALLGWQLLLLAALDVKHQWLPDRLTYLLIISGLLGGLLAGSPLMADRAIGAVTGFAVFWVVRLLYFRAREQEGLGQGDAKLLAGIGAWLGWMALPMVVLLACIIGLAGVFLSRLRGQAVAADTALPFGSYLAVAAFPLWLITTEIPVSALAEIFTL